MHVLKDICPKLNLFENPPVKNLSLDAVKQYLTQKHLKFCVLVVDADKVKDAYKSLSKRQKDIYQQLLQTAADKVGKTGLYCPEKIK